MGFHVLFIDLNKMFYGAPPNLSKNLLMSMGQKIVQNQKILEKPNIAKAQSKTWCYKLQ